MIAFATASTTLIEPAPPHTHSHIDLSGSGEAHPRGTPLVQRQGGRGLRKLGGTGWPSHQTDRGGRARAQAGRWQTRAEPAQPQRTGTEPAALFSNRQLDFLRDGIREVCCARSAVLPKGLVEKTASSLDSVLLSYRFSHHTNETEAGSPGGGFTATANISSNTAGRSPLCRRLLLPLR